MSRENTGHGSGVARVKCGRSESGNKDMVGILLIGPCDAFVYLLGTERERERKSTRVLRESRKITSERNWVSCWLRGCNLRPKELLEALRGPFKRNCTVRS